MGPLWQVEQPAPPPSRGREEQPGSALLLWCQGAVVSGQEPVPGRVAGDHGSQESGHCPLDGFVADKNVDVVLGSLFGERFGEELHEGRDLLQFGGLQLEHPVHGGRGLSHVFPRWKPVRVDADGCRGGITCQPSL